LSINASVLVHDPKRRFTTIDKCPSRDRTLSARMRRSATFFSRPPSFVKAPLCIAAHRDRVRISRRQAALTQRRGETEIRLDFEFDSAIGGERSARADFPSTSCRLAPLHQIARLEIIHPFQVGRKRNTSAGAPFSIWRGKGWKLAANEKLHRD